MRFHTSPFIVTFSVGSFPFASANEPLIECPMNLTCGIPAAPLQPKEFVRVQACFEQ